MDASEGGVTEETNQLRLMTERQQQRQGAVILPEMLISDHFQVSAQALRGSLLGPSQRKRLGRILQAL